VFVIGKEQVLQDEKSVLSSLVGLAPLEAFFPAPNAFGAGLLPALKPLKRIHEMADGLMAKEIMKKEQEVQLDIFTRF
jgi:hypothetical protein